MRRALFPFGLQNAAWENFTVAVAKKNKRKSEGSEEEEEIGKKTFLSLSCPAVHKKGT